MKNVRLVAAESLRPAVRVSNQPIIQRLCNADQGRIQSKQGPVQKKCGTPPLYTNTARLNSHYTHSDSVVIVDILLRTRIT